MIPPWNTSLKWYVSVHYKLILMHFSDRLGLNFDANLEPKKWLYFCFLSPSKCCKIMCGAMTRFHWTVLSSPIKRREEDQIILTYLSGLVLQTSTQSAESDDTPLAGWAMRDWYSVDISCILNPSYCIFHVFTLINQF